jgi:hypothetical protein
VRAKTALVLSIASATLAIAIIGVDLAFTLTTHLEAQTDGAWVSLASYPTDSFSKAGRGSFTCAPQDLRLRLDNNRPIGTTVDVLVLYSTVAGSRTAFQETWELGAFSERAKEFQVPDSAFPTTSTDPRPTVNLEIIVDGEYALSMCVERGA